MIKPGGRQNQSHWPLPNSPDAMENPTWLIDHGIEKFIAKSGKARGDDITVKLDLPKERKPGSTTLVVQVTPSMAVTMLDAPSLLPSIIRPAARSKP
jgi:hypothetical protein